MGLRANTEQSNEQERQSIEYRISQRSVWIEGKGKVRVKERERETHCHPPP